MVAIADSVVVPVHPVTVNSIHSVGFVVSDGFVGKGVNVKDGITDRVEVFPVVTR